jgi:hypothetical protein
LRLRGARKIAFIKTKPINLKPLTGKLFVEKEFSAQKYKTFKMFFLKLCMTLFV